MTAPKAASAAPDSACRLVTRVFGPSPALIWQTGRSDAGRELRWCTGRETAKAVHGPVMFHDVARRATNVPTNSFLLHARDTVVDSLEVVSQGALSVGCGHPPQYQNSSNCHGTGQGSAERLARGVWQSYVFCGSQGPGCFEFGESQKVPPNWRPRVSGQSLPTDIPPKTATVPSPKGREFRFGREAKDLI